MHQLHGGRSIWKGAVAGLAGGLAASWVMNEFQAGVAKLTRHEQGEDEPQAEDATMRTAGAVAESLFGRELTTREKEVAGPAVHYAFGGAMGAVYGALAETSPSAGAGRGLTFGSALWFGADELAVPAVRLSGSPFQYPVSTHALALSSHLVYGVTLDFVRRMIRGVL